MKAKTNYDEDIDIPLSSVKRKINSNNISDNNENTPLPNKQLKLHSESDETEVKEFICEFCCIKVSDYSSLQRHIQRIHHNEEWTNQCSNCKKRFFTPTELKIHLKTDSSCSVIGDVVNDIEVQCYYCSDMMLKSVVKKHFVEVHNRKRGSIKVKVFIVGFNKDFFLEKCQAKICKVLGKLCGQRGQRGSLGCS